MFSKAKFLLTKLYHLWCHLLFNRCLVSHYCILRICQYWDTKINKFSLPSPPQGALEKSDVNQITIYTHIHTHTKKSNSNCFKCFQAERVIALMAYNMAWQTGRGRLPWSGHGTEVWRLAEVIRQRRMKGNQAESLVSAKARDGKGQVSHSTGSGSVLLSVKVEEEMSERWGWRLKWAHSAPGVTVHPGFDQAGVLAHS